MTENELARIVVDVAYRIHSRLGPGLLESVYHQIMRHEFQKLGIRVESEVSAPVIWDDRSMDNGFRLDLLLERKLIVELKSIEAIAPVHKKTVLTYLRITDCRLGLLINFNVERIKDGIWRIVNGLEE